MTPDRRDAQGATDSAAGAAVADQRIAGVVASATFDEVSQAFDRCEFPGLVLWNGEGTVVLANQAAADTVGLALDQVVGHSVTEFVHPASLAARVVQELVSGEFDAYRGSRQLVTTLKQNVDVYVWTRAIEVDDSRGGLSAWVPRSQIGRLGRHPKRAWLDLVPVAVGTIDAEGMICAVSADIEELFDRTAGEPVGKRFLDYVHPDDVSLLAGPDGRLSTAPVYRPRIRYLGGTGDYVEACTLLGPLEDAGPGESVFALIGLLDKVPMEPADRIAELEMRLRRIGAEIRAAGMTGMVGSFPQPVLPEINDLTTRQWEILSRLLQGERVPTIARGLFLSESTVRNHLATIFRKYGVHTQTELLELLRSLGVPPASL